MRNTIRTAVVIGLVLLLGYGVFQPIEAERVWLVCVWLAAPLLGVLVWLNQPNLPRGLSRSVYNLGLVIAVGFMLLSLQLLRQQFVQAGAIYDRVVTDADGGTTSNIRPVLTSQRILRGEIRDRNGVVLVGNEEVAGGFARRTYPMVDVQGFDPAAFGNLVGFFSLRFGQSGLEATYGDYLNGNRGSAIAQLEQDLLGEEKRGNNLTLTINAQLQNRVQALLAGRTGSVVVLNPRTGEILAMASAPGFDPRLLNFDPATDDRQAENERIAAYWNQLNSDAAGQPLINRPTQGRYPPGSTFKTLTAVSALENPDVAQPNDIRCFNTFEAEPNTPPIVNAVDNLASLTGDPATLERVYAYSCNVAFAQYALRLGPERFTATAEAFDIFAPQDAPENYTTFADLPTLPSLLYVDPGFLNQPRALADTGYGQGQLLVTPLQMALMTAAVANDGVIMQPYLVQRVSRPDANQSVVLERTPRRVRQALPPEIAAQMRDNMRAVAAYGFGSAVSNYTPGIVVGGKSGTAQHVPGATPHAWFTAIAPIDNPRYAVAVMLEAGGEGSSVGANLAGQVLQAAFESE